MNDTRRPMGGTPTLPGRWRTAAFGVATVLALGTAPSGMSTSGECLGVEAWVSVLAGPAMGLDDKHCVYPTACDPLTSGRHEVGPASVILIGVGVWVPHPLEPDPLCLT